MAETTEHLVQLQRHEEVSDAEKTCPYCGGISSSFVSSTDFNRRTTSLTFDYYQCTKCRLVFMSPIPSPDEMRPFYAGGYQSIPKTLAELRSIAKKETFRLNPILKYKSGGKLLEIGPWMGIFSCNAKDAGFDVTAIEIDRECIDFLKDTLQIKAIQSSDPAKTLGQMSEKFDVIAMWHALEHLPTPWLVVQKAAERLAPGGVLLIAIPNIDSLEFSILKERWRHLDTPRHLYFHPANSLVALCQANGLTKLEMTTTDELSDVLSRDTWHIWARSKVNIKYVRGILGRIRYYFERNKVTEDSGCGLTALFQAPVHEKNSPM